jgi:hypothetical protein
MTVVSKHDFVINFDQTAGIQRGPYDMLYGIAFIGDLGTIVTDRSKVVLYPEWDNEQKKFMGEEYSYTEGKESHGEHVRNFIDCVKSRNQPACPPEIGRAAALHAHFPNIAARSGESILIWMMLPDVLLIAKKPMSLLPRCTENHGNFRKYNCH